MGLNFFVADATEVNCSRKNRKKLHVIVPCSKHLSIVRSRYFRKSRSKTVDDLNGFESDFLADNAYECKMLRTFLRRRGFNPIIPYKKTSYPKRLYPFDEKKYRQRGVDEGVFSALKRKKIKNMLKRISPSPIT